MPGFPRLPDCFYEQWHGLDGAVRHDGDRARRVLRHAAVQGPAADARRRPSAMLRRDIEHAAKLGCTVVAHAAPGAAGRGGGASSRISSGTALTLVFEIHNPRHFDDEKNTQWLPLFERHPEQLGYLLDLGIFVRRLPRVMMERFLRDGAQERVVAARRRALRRRDRGSGGDARLPGGAARRDRVDGPERDRPPDRPLRVALHLGGPGADPAVREAHPPRPREVLGDDRRRRGVLDPVRARSCRYSSTPATRAGSRASTRASGTSRTRCRSTRSSRCAGTRSCSKRVLGE